MKAQCDLRQLAAAKPIDRKLMKGRIGKEGTDYTQEEMQTLLLKLKTLVPNMPKNRKLSKLEIIQYVIDYIMDLQIALETHPASKPNVLASISRQPLGVLSPARNTCAAQEVTQIEKNTIIAEVITVNRPVSC